tara:strand:- start:365 stop:1000 length:636 start_codon:yes stop_codon:yes gene_type:complete
MRIEELLEAPLPASWDSEIYSDRVPFKTRLKYAKERAQQIGRGSSRVAFKIKYKGQDTVLKIAMNQKGAAQNRAEADLLDDWVIEQTGMVIPLIDYDEKSAYPTWIHTRYAHKMKDTDFPKFLAGAKLIDVIEHILNRAGEPGYRYLGTMTTVTEKTLETRLYQGLEELAFSYSPTLIKDLATASNWGLYNRRPVIIDIGYSDSTKHLYDG